VQLTSNPLVFAELYRKTRRLEVLNAELERRVEERTAELGPCQGAALTERMLGTDLQPELR
jgi:hypothetical protein